MNSPNLHEPLANLSDLRSVYVENLSERISSVEALWEYLQKRWDNSTAAELLAQLKDLAGGAEAFHLKEIGEAAHYSEELLVETLKSSARGAEPANYMRAELLTAIQTIRRFANEIQNSMSAYTSAGRDVFLLEPDQERARATEALLRRDGYQVRVFGWCKELARGLRETKPALVIIPDQAPDGNPLELLSGLSIFKFNQVPAILVSDSESLVTRMAARQAGALFWHHREKNPERLALLVGKILRPVRESGSIVFFLQNEPMVAVLCNELGRFGIRTAWIPNPRADLDLSAGVPDIIVVEEQTPVCTGIELCRVLRQDERLAGTAVFLVTGNRQDPSLLEALQSGVNELLGWDLTAEELYLRLARLKTRDAQVRPVIPAPLPVARPQPAPPPPPVIIRDPILENQLSVLRDEKQRLELRVGELEEKLRVPAIQSSSKVKPGDLLQGSAGMAYVLGNLLANGATSTTFEATREHDGLQVAIKVLNPEFGARREATARFAHEARILMELRHPNLVRGLDYSQNGTHTFLVMELIPGPSLLTYIENAPPADPLWATEVMLEVARALEHLHTRSLVHRDVKPANVIISGRGEVRLVDFGIVCCTPNPTSLTSVGMIVGTPLYMSPEQIYGDTLDTRSDIYSLGATYFHAVCGRPPYPGNTFTEILEKRAMGLPDPQKIRQDLPAPVAITLKRMLAVKKQWRPESPAAVISELQNVIAHLKQELVIPG